MKFEVNLSESSGMEERIRRKARRKNMKDMKDCGMESKRLELLLSNSFCPVTENRWKCWRHDPLSSTSKHQNVHVDKRHKIKLTAYIIIFDRIWSYLIKRCHAMPMFWITNFPFHGDFHVSRCQLELCTLKYLKRFLKRFHKKNGPNIFQIKLLDFWIFNAQVVSAKLPSFSVHGVVGTCIVHVFL